MDKEFKEDVKSFMSNTNEFKEDVTAFMASTNEFKEDVTAFMASTNEFKEDVTAFMASTNEFKEDVTAFMASTNDKFSSIDEILADLRRSTLLIEDYITNKIPALFDAYGLNQDQHNTFNQKIDNLEDVTDHHSVQISILEDTSKIHSDKLQKLAL